MQRFLKTILAATFLLIIGLAQANQEINGITINRVYIDPSDIVVLTDTPNGCGSNFYHLPRSNTNFREMFAFIFLAYKSSLPINFEVPDECSNERRFISHGSMGN